jgi:uncharacterized lipoprotein YddW (UPF0748 family)
MLRMQLYFIRWTCCALLSLASLSAQKSELRGAWIARDSMSTKESLRAAIESLAAANFNAVYINVWSRGYPLWPSKAFERETGLRMDPAFVGRDVMAECLEAGTPVGIACIPWLEYGFVAGYSGYFAGENRWGPLFDRHPDWLARRRDGSFHFPVSGTQEFFYWMAHTRPDVQDWLIELMRELVQNYKIDSIQFDRARYPDLDCGYDDFTKELYAKENNGRTPPDRPDDSAWRLWRSVKLNEFLQRVHRELKAVDWRITITNAPVTYPYAFNLFAQDYPAWMRERSLDYVSPQIYRSTEAAFVSELNSNLRFVADASRLVPGIDITNSKNPELLIRMIEICREKGLGGIAIWYYNGLVSTNSLERLRQTVFFEKAPLPWRSSQLP